MKKDEKQKIIEAANIIRTECKKHNSCDECAYRAPMDDEDYEIGRRPYCALSDCPAAWNLDKLIN